MSAVTAAHPATLDILRPLIDRDQVEAKAG